MASNMFGVGSQKIVDYFGAIFDLKALALLYMIYAFERKSNRDYITRDELLKVMKTPPEKARALDIRLKKLLKTGWLEQGGAKGRYKLTVLARDYLLHIGKASRRVVPYLATEEIPTQQVLVKVKVPYAEYMRSENFFSFLERMLVRKEYEVIYREKLSLGVRKSKELEIVLIEGLIEPGEVEVRATSGSGHLLKLTYLAPKFLKIPEKETISEIDMLRNLALAAFFQIYDALTETFIVGLGVTHEPLEVEITAIEKTKKPEFYVFKKPQTSSKK